MLMLLSATHTDHKLKQKVLADDCTTEVPSLRKVTFETQIIQTPFRTFQVQQKQEYIVVSFLGRNINHKVDGPRSLARDC
jgi:hypothetical protein